MKCAQNTHGVNIEMTGIARQLAISETQLINKGIENMRIMCVEVGVLEETLCH